jgi:hypothetical protein
MNFPLASADQKPALGLGSVKALHAPLGAASPLWFAYAGAAGAGMAYWWMTRWMRPFNIEALIAVAEPAQTEVVAAESAAAPWVEAEPAAPEASIVEEAPQPAVAAMPEPEAPPVADSAVAEAAIVEAALAEPEPAPKAAAPQTSPAAAVQTTPKTRKASGKAGPARSD